MNPLAIRFFSVLAIGTTFVFPRAGLALEEHAGLPLPNDFTETWWRDGFPNIVNDADWRRIIRTGYYWCVFDTDTLQPVRLGPASESLGELSGAKLALTATVDGKVYRCTGSSPWSRFEGPRLIESGRFLQRSDVRGLVFTSADGVVLNGESRLEVIAWPDQLGFALFVRPGLQSIVGGDMSFGRVGGGFGLDGSNHFEISDAECAIPARFTLSFWVYMPTDYRAGKHTPWMLCKNRHEEVNGNIGVVMHEQGVPEVRLNIGGGKQGMISARAAQRHALRYNAWNHVAISYDGNTLRLFVNDHFAVEEKVGRPFVPLPGDLAFGTRQDGAKGFEFRGVLDEIRVFSDALDVGLLRSITREPSGRDLQIKPIKQWSFRADRPAALKIPREQWRQASLDLEMVRDGETLASEWQLPGSQVWSDETWQHVALQFDPQTFTASEGVEPVQIKAEDRSTGKPRPVIFESNVGWHRVNLDGVEPVAPPNGTNPSHDAVERINLRLVNPTNRERMVRLMFEKSAHGIRQRIGTPITGISAMLRDVNGRPTGIPIQLSKNWHVHREAGTHAGQWFHGISQVRLPANFTKEMELTIAYGHWGGIPAASHAQLSLVGWGGNQLWDQSALGSWGESICYDPLQAQAGSTITDVRPFLVTGLGSRTRYNWTHNVGGGDFIRFFKPGGERMYHAGMRASYVRQGPCLTEVTYSGSVSQTPIHHAITVSLQRCDDYVVGTYRIRMNVDEAVSFSRLVLFQIGSDTYATTREKKLAVGDAKGLLSEWVAQWGDNEYRGKPMECRGRTPWASLHESEGGRSDNSGAWANRGFVIREWQARLGGREVRPWIAERGLDLPGGYKTSTLDVLPPPGVNRLEKGDYLDAVIEHLVIPQFAKDYYGSNVAMREALAKDQNTWRMVHRQAVGDQIHVTVKVGRLVHSWPDVRVAAQDDRVVFTMEGGLGHVPVTVTGLTSPKRGNLLLDGKPLDQAVHGNDFWQTEYDARTQTWSRTYNLPGDVPGERTIVFEP